MADQPSHPHRSSSGPIRLLIAACLLAFATGASAATFAVDSAGDERDNTPGNGICQTASGTCTLRAAIIEANTLPGPDVITFAINPIAGGFRIQGAGDDSALAGDLDIVDSLTILGNGVLVTVIEGETDRVFHVDPFHLGIELVVRDLTIRGGRTSGDGGGMLIQSLLQCQPTPPLRTRVTLERVRLIDNRARSGGGIDSRAYCSELTLRDVVLEGNLAESAGALANAGLLVMEDVSIVGNRATHGTAGAELAGLVRGERVTVADNNAVGPGYYGTGGMSAGGSVTLVNATVSGNVGDPGGIWTGGSMTLTNATFSGNTGAIRNCDNCGARTRLANSIIAASGFYPGANCQGTMTSLGNNLEDSSSCGFTAAGDLINQVPGLDVLMNNGGRTLTHALLSTSPAVDAAPASACPPRDQRGVSRPQGPRCDAGAFEYQTRRLVVIDPRDAPDTNPGDGFCVSTVSRRGPCTLRAAIMEANALPGPDIIEIALAAPIHVDIVGAGEELARTGDLDVTDDLTIVGLGPAITSIEAAPLLGDRLFHVRAGPNNRPTTLRLEGHALSGGTSPDGAGGCLLNERLGSLILLKVSIAGCTAATSIVNYGGAIANFGDLLMRDSAVRNSSAPGSVGALHFGGGLYSGGSARIERSEFTGNSSGDSGGAIWFELGSRASIADSLVAGNQAGRFAGGIGNRGSLNVSRSSFEKNGAGATGGAIGNRIEGMLDVTGSTFLANQAGSQGSAIENSGTFTLHNSTVSNNVAADAAISTSGAVSRGTIGFVTFFENGGGGIRLGTGQATIRGSILKEAGAGLNCLGPVVSGGGNVDSGHSCSFTGATDISGVAPLLLPLAANGGLTPTHALAPMSPAIDRIPAPCSGVDQRGVARPQGAGCDSGAFER